MGANSVFTKTEHGLLVPARKRRVVPLVCKLCGTTFLCPTTRSKNQKFCSQTCANNHPDHHKTRKERATRERNGKRIHRAVMEEYLGRELDSQESVHHIDGDRTNNDIGNLQLRRTFHGMGQRYRCLDCGSENISTVKL